MRQLPNVTDIPSVPGAEAQPRFPTWQGRTRTGAAPFPAGPGWVVHVPVMVPDLDAALTVAEQMATWLGCLPQADVGAMEVSAEDEQSRRVRVICDRRLGRLSRCGLRDGHEGECREVQQHTRSDLPLPLPKRRASVLQLRLDEPWSEG